MADWFKGAVHNALIHPLLPLAELAAAAARAIYRLHDWTARERELVELHVPDPPELLKAYIEPLDPDELDRLNRREWWDQ